MKKNVFIILLFLLAICSCKQEVTEERPEFTGHWFASFGDNNVIHFDIDENSQASYQMTLEGYARKKYTGTARANGQRLTIGGTRYFDIIEYPHMIDTSIEKYTIYDYENQRSIPANWMMVLDGMKPGLFYADGTWTFYKADYE